MMRDRKELLIAYMNANIAPILVDFIDFDHIPHTVLLPATIDVKELNGHYEGVNFLPPTWFTKLKSPNEGNLLVIDRIDLISKEEQLKFGELLKYRKISTFELPDHVVIIVTAKNINADKINPEIFSMLVQV